MDSRELGLLLARQLFGLEDLHFGMWGDGETVSLTTFPAAQGRFTDYLLDRLPPPTPGAGPRVLDVGCGTGHMLCCMLARGYRADGVSPSATLNEIARQRLAALPGHDSRLFPCRFEALSTGGLTGHYDVVLFSESFQFVKMHKALPIVQTVLRPGGQLLICDVFSRQGPTRDPIRSGHALEKFFRLMDATPFISMEDVDITRRVSPTIALLQEVLAQRIAPAAMSLGRYIDARHPVAAWLGRRLWGRRLDRIRRRHLGGEYSRQSFERDKSYRFFRYRLPEAA